MIAGLGQAEQNWGKEFHAEHTKMAFLFSLSKKTAKLLDVLPDYDGIVPLLI